MFAFGKLFRPVVSSLLVFLVKVVRRKFAVSKPGVSEAMRILAELVDNSLLTINIAVESSLLLLSVI